MIVHELKQNTPEWDEHRVLHRNASETAAMLNMSKHMTRNELLHLKKTGETKPISDFLQKIFDNGHRAEALARPIAEEIIGESLYPITGSLENTLLSSSYDGATILNEVNWEHKLINDELRASLQRGIIPKEHHPQLEQQQMINGAEITLFMASNGTKDDMKYVWYYSDETLRNRIIEGWKQFDIDLKNYKAKEEIKVVAEVTNMFPVITYSVDDSIVVSNLKHCLATVKGRAKLEMEKSLVTDQDFADKELLNKDVKKARANLKKLVADIKAGFESVAAFEELAKEYDSVLQKMQSSGEKQVKQEKDRIKSDLINKALKSLNDHIKELAEGLNNINAWQHISEVDFEAAIKGKSKLSAIENAIDSTLSAAKSEINIIMERILKNYDYLMTAGHEHLFKDASVFIAYDYEAFKAVVDSRLLAEIERIDEIKKQAEEKAESEAVEKARDTTQKPVTVVTYSSGMSHQKRINNEVMLSLLKFGLDEKQGKDLIKAINTNKIANVTIKY